MNKLVLIIIVLLGLNVKSHSQSFNLYIDSLKKEAIHEQIDSNKGEIYTEIARSYLNKNSDSSLLYARKSIAVFKSDKYRLSKIYSAMAKVYRDKALLDSSKYYTRKSIVIAKKNNFIDLEGVYMCMLGNSFLFEEKYDSAIIYLQNSYEILRKIKHKKTKLPINSIYAYYYRTEQFIEAKKWAYKLKEHLNSTNSDDLYSYSVLYNNLSASYSRLEQNDSAKYYIFKSHEINLKLNKTKALISSNINISDHYKNENKLDSALLFLNNGLALAENTNKIYPQILILIKLSDVLFDKKAYNKALITLKKAENLCLKYNTATHNLISIYALTFDIHLINKNFESSREYFNKYDSLNNLFLEENRIKSIREADTKFKNFERENENQKLRTEKAEQALITQNTKAKTTLIIGVLCLLIILTLFYFSYQRNKSQKQIYNLKNQALRLQMSPHFLFNAMNSISNFISLNKPKEAKQYLAKFSKVMRLSLESVQEDNIPIKKEIEFLTNYIEIEKLRHKNFEYEIIIDNSIDVENTAIPPVLIQPFIENSILHGFIDKNQMDKGNLNINFSYVNNNILITIKDDGIGIKKTKEIKEHKSLALSITQKRVNIFNNKKTAIVFSTPKNSTGTIINFTLPVVSYSYSYN